MACGCLSCLATRSRLVCLSAVCVRSQSHSTACAVCTLCGVCVSLGRLSCPAVRACRRRKVLHLGIALYALFRFAFRLDDILPSHRMRDTPLTHPFRFASSRRHSTPLPLSQGWRSRGDLFHVAVRQNLRNRDTALQTRTAYHADDADVRPRRSQHAYAYALPIGHNTGCGHSQKRRPDSVVGNFEVVRKSAFFAIHASADFG